ncbi:glutamine synthetase family protein [Haloarcula brevis]|uniref:glutamine synthetase family protein n=1 Tax=Haloarcula brevis TaxID=3111453 RepID=UPI00300F4DF4
MSSSPDDFDTVRLFWSDIHGVVRGVSMSADAFGAAREEGMGFANGVAELTLEPGMLDDPQFGPETGDMLAVPSVETLAPLSWRDGEGVVFADLRTVDGRPFPLCARTALRSVLDEYRDEGFEPFAGVEVEFSLYADEEGREPFNTRTSYDMAAIDRAAEVIDEWNDAMAAAGHDLTSVHQESQPGQYEVTLEYGDPLSTMDGTVFLRHAVGALARRRGIEATFMPRPRGGEAANGTHFHVSLWDEAGEENRFAGPADDALQFPAGHRPADGGLSETARHFVGGVLSHVDALTALCAPTVNSYKRLVPDIWAPTTVGWGLDNRSTVLRIPPELGAGARVEHRLPDSACNPYLAMAATLAAGLDGIRSETVPDDPIETGTAPDGNRLPRTLWSALDALAADDVLRDALGADLVTEFVKLKREEFDRYQNSVGGWETDEYFDAF